MKYNYYLRRKAIWLYLREGDQTFPLHTGEEINPELWNKKSQRADSRKVKDNIKKGALRHLNNYLDDFEFRIKKIVREIRSIDPSSSFDTVAEAVKQTFNTKKKGIFDIYEEFLDYKKIKVTERSGYKLRRAKDLLQEYDERMSFDKVTPAFFENFFAFLITKKGMLNNTAYKNIQFLKSFLIWANNNGFTNNNSYKSFHGKNESNEVIYLTEEELMKLYNMKFEEDEEKLERVRDTFVFQCFTGVRYSDILNISREDISENTWQIRTQKTHQLIEIPLNHYAISILDKYSTHQKPLPVISNQKMNDYLKELCKKAEINSLEKIVRYQGNIRKRRSAPQI